MKELINKIKKSNFVKLINFRTTIKDLNEEIGELEKKIQKSNDIIRNLEIENRRIEELENRIPSMELVIASSDKTLKSKMDEIEKLKEEKIKIMCELFNTKNELIEMTSEKEKCEEQIKDLKSDRYLVKKLKPGRTPNTNKTKISMPMSGNVTRYMRGEHE